MGGDKNGPKRGRYVGGFLQLFDWNAKSRKKLFPSKSDLPEQSKQGNKCEDTSVSWMREEEEEDFGGGPGGSSIRAGSEYSYASSITDDDGYGTKAPGVVARLMGLNSLPTSNILESYPSPFSDTLSLPEAQLQVRNLDIHQDHQAIHSSHLLDKVESRSKIGKVTMPQKMPIRPIEKFQSEMLPPKSAKTIPITHHKLLSPIKRPIYVTSQNKAHIMAAAAKIIEPGPQATPRAKIPSPEASSVPFKVREMREKLKASDRTAKDIEPSHRQVKSNAAKRLREQQMNKSWNGDDSSTAVKGKSKSVSLAIQAKVNVQRREGFTSSNRSLASEEQNHTKSTQSFRNPNSKSFNQSNSSVLRINNQKQNYPPFKDKSTSKITRATSAGKKSVIEDASNGRLKSSRKSCLQARNGDKGTPYSGTRNVPRKKRSINGSLNFNKNQVNDKSFAKKHENPNQSSMIADKHFNWVEESRRKGMDVISFTFTAPMTRSLPVSEQLKVLTEKSSDLFNDDSSTTLMNSDITSLTSQRFQGIQGDALSVLLEQKLKELASDLGIPQGFVKTGTGEESAHRTMFSLGTVESDIGKVREKADQQELGVNEMFSHINFGSAANESQTMKRIFNFQAGEAVEDFSDNTETKQWNCHISSPVSILEPSMLTGSYYSSESLASSITEERKPYSSVFAQEVVDMNPVQKFYPMVIDTETSDSASSTASQIIVATDSEKPNAWELGYITNMLCNVELMFKDYVTGRTCEIMNPNLFDHMERRRHQTQIDVNESKLERKVLFDSVGEWLDLKCRQFIGGGFQMWTKGIASFKRKDRLAEEVYKEIKGWKSLGKSMVDEVVDKDMSSKYGRWLDFQADEFMLGVEIESHILDSLVVELLSDLSP